MYIEPANQIIGFIYGSLYSKFSCVLYINDKFSWISQLSIHKYTSYFQIDIEMIIKKDKKNRFPTGRISNYSFRFWYNEIKNCFSLSK